MTIWAIFVPFILIAGELDFIHVAGEAQLRSHAGEVELHAKSCCAAGMFVNRKERPLFIGASYSIDANNR